MFAARWMGNARRDRVPSGPEHGAQPRPERGALKVRARRMAPPVRAGLLDVLHHRLAAAPELVSQGGLEAGDRVVDVVDIHPWAAQALTGKPVAVAPLRPQPVPHLLDAERAPGGDEAVDGGPA